MARNNSRNKAEKAVEVTDAQVEVIEDSKVMTDGEIASKYGYNEHTWEGTVAIWQKKKELGIK